MKYFGALRYGKRLRPERDWLVLLSLSVVLLLASIAWNVWFFVTIGSGENSAPAQASTQTVSSASAVTNVQNVFKARATEQSNYQNTYQFVDPSQ